MKKILPKKHKKIWGYESWLHSPLKGEETQTEEGELIKKGPLIKIIKADKPLSVQVHPDDLLAKELENEPNGKSESWYVLEANEKTEYIVGIKTMDRKKIRAAIDNKDFFPLLKTLKPRVGQFINVPAGLVHGIGGGSKVLEVQQPSDTTYRFYDYDRLENGKPRDLHIEKSLKSIKDLEWEIENNNNTEFYTTNEYVIEILQGVKVLKEDCIVIDLKDEIAYLASKGEEVSFEKWAAVREGGRKCEF